MTYRQSATSNGEVVESALHRSWAATQSVRRRRRRRGRKRGGGSDGKETRQGVEEEGRGEGTRESTPQDIIETS